MGFSPPDDRVNATTRLAWYMEIVLQFSNKKPFSISTKYFLGNRKLIYIRKNKKK
jgi:hypothetical protein